MLTVEAPGGRAWNATPVALSDQAGSERAEEIGRDALTQGPEAAYEALQEWRGRQAAEAAEAADRRRFAVLEHQDELFRDPADPIGGNAEGDVILVEFFDYRSENCQRMADWVEGLIKEDDRLKVVFKEFPILGEDSLRAARAALASREQGAYGRFHFALMRAEDLSEAGIVNLAEENGLDAARLLADMQASEIDETIERNRALARRLGIDGTPTFLIGDLPASGAVEP